MEIDTPQQKKFRSKSEEFWRFKLLGNFVNFIYTLTYVDLNVIALSSKKHQFYGVLEVTIIECFFLLLSILDHFWLM